MNRLQNYGISVRYCRGVNIGGYSTVQIGSWLDIDSKLFSERDSLTRKIDKKTRKVISVQNHGCGCAFIYPRYMHQSYSRRLQLPIFFTVPNLILALNDRRSLGSIWVHFKVMYLSKLTSIK